MFLPLLFSNYAVNLNDLSDSLLCKLIFELIASHFHNNHPFGLSDGVFATSDRGNRIPALESRRAVSCKAAHYMSFFPKQSSHSIGIIPFFLFKAV